MTIPEATPAEFDRFLALRRDQIDHQEELTLEAVAMQRDVRSRCESNIRSGLAALLSRSELWRRIGGGNRIPDHSTPAKRSMWRELRTRAHLLIDIETARFSRKLLPKEDR